MVEPLLPDRYPIADFFVCDILDTAPKDDIASMEHPLFSLSTKPDTRIREYGHNGNNVKITPSGQGLATIHDKDILIYCISQILAKINKGEKSKRMVSLKVTLSEWMYNSVLGKEVLTLSRDYFRLRKPIERRVYELARKHCDTSVKWEIGFELLQKKCGSSAPKREFRRAIKVLVQHDHLPDYRVKLEENDNVIFYIS